MLTINNSLFKMGGREVSWEMNAPVNMCECVYECQCGSRSTCKFQPTEKKQKKNSNYLDVSTRACVCVRRFL